MQAKKGDAKVLKATAKATVKANGKAKAKAKGKAKAKAEAKTAKVKEQAKAPATAAAKATGQPRWAWERSRSQIMCRNRDGSCRGIKYDKGGEKAAEQKANRWLSEAVAAK